MREDRIWGDGFASDDWRQLARVRDWRQISADELVRLFPALAAVDRGAPPPVAAIALARAAAIDAETAPARSSRPPGAATAADAEFLRRAVSSASPPDADLWDMARFAYLTAVHPAYVWPQAGVLAGWGAAAAWLGALSRRGAAFLPEEVAEYLVDVGPADADSGATIRDPLIADLARRCVDPAQLLQAARRRRDGATVIVRRRPDIRGEARFAGALLGFLRRIAAGRGSTAAAGNPAP